MSSLGQAILQTVAYFGIFDHPLTVMEVWRFLYAPGMEPQDYEKVWSELQTFAREGKIETRNGFYFLPGQEAAVETRSVRYTLSFKKYRRARRVAKFLSVVPGVRLVALGNTMAWRAARAESDIDFFVITAPGRIWTTRILSTFPISAFGLRPQKTNSADAICLSFYASEDALDLRRLMIEGDIYFPYWVASLVPLCAAEGVYEKFKAQNAWIKEYLPNIFFREPAQEIKKVSFMAKLAFPQIFEILAKKAQIKSFPSQIKQLSSREGTSVIASDHYLKFHVDDRREEIRDKWREKIKDF